MILLEYQYDNVNSLFEALESLPIALRVNLASIAHEVLYARLFTSIYSSYLLVYAVATQNYLELPQRTPISVTSSSLNVVLLEELTTWN